MALQRNIDGILVDMTPEEEAEFRASLPAPTPAEFVQVGTEIIQRHLDATARQHGYDSIATAIGYRGDPNPTFAAEADALFVFRSEVWTQGLAMLDEVRSGERAMPSEAELIAGLPAYGSGPMRLTSTAFMDLFTDDEELAIAAATLTDAELKTFYDRALAAGVIDMSSPKVTGGTSALVAAGLITSARRARILQGLPPE